MLKALSFKLSNFSPHTQEMKSGWVTPVHSVQNVLGKKSILTHSPFYCVLFNTVLPLTVPPVFLFCPSIRFLKWRLFSWLRSCFLPSTPPQASPGPWSTSRGGSTFIKLLLCFCFPFFFFFLFPLLLLSHMFRPAFPLSAHCSSG